MRESFVGKTLAALRDDGYRVKVSHTRRYISPGTGREYFMDNATARRMREDGVKNLVPLPTGGLVLVRVESPGGEHAAGFSGCSARDNFVGLRGTAIALGRALDALADAQAN